MRRSTLTCDRWGDNCRHIIRHRSGQDMGWVRNFCRRPIIGWFGNRLHFFPVNLINAVQSLHILCTARYNIKNLHTYYMCTSCLTMYSVCSTFDGTDRQTDRQTDALTLVRILCGQCQKGLHSQFSFSRLSQSNDSLIARNCYVSLQQMINDRILQH